MANRSLFSAAQPQAPRADVLNEAGGKAYRLESRLALAQLALTGCLNTTYYADAEVQLDTVLNLCLAVEPEFVARTAVHARTHGRMKDLPALLAAYLAAFDGELLTRVFDRVIDDGKMLRTFVQILRSGRVGRKSLGSLPKRLVQRWLVEASDEQLIRAMVGNSPSLADVIKMVHPKAHDERRAALFGYLIGRPVDVAKLPQAIVDFECFKQSAAAPVPAVPFQLLTALDLSTAHWTRIAEQASWTQLRMNLNTFARHGVFEDHGVLRRVAKRLADPTAVRRAKVFPYQLLAAVRATDRLPGVIREALSEALEVAVANVPRIGGSVAVAVDVSGSMASPVTGYRPGATTAVRCVDVAALFAASMLAVNRGAVVLPFNDRVQSWQGRSRSLLETTEALAGLLGGGTAVSAPLAELLRREFAPDLTVIVSDNQSWLDQRQGPTTETQRLWNELRRRNPDAKLVCIDLQPYTHTPLAERADVLNIGGFSDAVFELTAAFAQGRMGAGHWVGEIEDVPI